MITVLIAALFAILPASHAPVGHTPHGCTFTVNGQTYHDASGNGEQFTGPDMVVFCWYGRVYIQTSP